MDEESSSADIYLITTLNEFPPEIIKFLTKEVKLSKKKINQHIDIVCTLLRVATDWDKYYHPDTWENYDMLDKYVKNELPSLVSDQIVSVASLEEERAALLEEIDIDDYRVFDEVGQGAFGAVCAADSKIDGEMVAIKRTEHDSRKQRRDNFQEIRFLKFCRHPNVMRFIRAGPFVDEEGHKLMLMVTEYIVGSMLKSFNKTYQFGETEMAYIAHEILSGVEFLHENQIVHRDLKPGNIMLDIKGQVKIIDMGLCADISQRGIVDITGSPFWMAPEIIQLQLYSTPVDIFSIGVIIMEIANGERPFPDNPIKAMFTAATEGYPKPLKKPRHWSSNLSNFLHNTLALSPTDRWTAKDLKTHSFITNRVSQQSFKETIISLVDIEVK